jgi:hypothetical protein
MVPKFFLMLMLLCNLAAAQTPIKGCKDPAATNYNSAATITDGSCLYTTTSLVPIIKVEAMATTLAETSGLQWDGKNLWTFNDGGGIAAIYKIDTLTNAIWQTVYLAGVTNVDWEDIAFDGTYFYIGDIGNNSNGARDNLVIYKFPASAIPEHTSQAVATIPADKISNIRFSYADQPKPLTPVAANSTAYDCEAMLVADNGIHLFTKNWSNKTTTHYKINGTTAGTYIAEAVETVAVNYLVTGVDKGASGRALVLIGYNNEGFGSHYLHILTDYSEGKYFNGNSRKISLPDAITLGQAEGLTFRNGAYGYISNERFERSAGGITLTVNPKLRSFDIAQLIPSYILPIQLKTFTVQKQGDAFRIAWQYDASVDNFSVQHSRDGIQYDVIYSAQNTTQGSTTHKPSTDNYYRLRWQDDKGKVVYSNVIQMSGEGSAGLEKLVLKSGSGLSFQVSGSEPQEYAFRLITTEGKVLAKKEAQDYLPGKHTVYFPAVGTLGTIVLVSISSKEGTVTKQLSVQ